jgi:alkylation response protein AidB-like acyl-CoA dehydrogenase
VTSVDLHPDDEQLQVVDATRQILRNGFPLAILARAEGRRVELERRWKLALAAGWTGVSLPAQIGGSALGPAEEVLVFRELGRALVTPCVLASLLAAQTVAGDDPVLAAAFVSGEQRVALGFATGASGGAIGPVSVLDLEGATELVCFARDGGVVLLPHDTVTLPRAAECIDPTLMLTHGELKPAPAGAAKRLPPDLTHRASLLISAQLVGLAEAARDMALEHAKLREQFGQPIGAFQAVAHHCVDMELRAQAALAQLSFAAIACRDGRGDAPFQIRAAGHVANDAAFRNATMNIRILGGMGYSEESGAHLYLKRALVLRALLGDEASARNALLTGAVS